MTDLPLPEGARVLKCRECPSELMVSEVEAGETKVIHLGDGFHQALTTHETDKPKPKRAKHNADGTTKTVEKTPRKATTDPKPRGRRRG